MNPQTRKEALGDNTLTVRLAPKTQKTLEELSAQKGLSPEEYVGRLLDILLFEQWLEKISAPLRPQLAEMGITCDEDVFEIVS